MAAFASARIDGEVIVSDNGSTDGSKEAARAAGARIVETTNRGYGNALMAGIDSAKGQFVIMGDADGSYDFRDLPLFVNKLRAGHNLVQGCRLARGGGTIVDGAMPLSHRLIGNPLLSFLARLMFHTPLSDVYCGLRGFEKSFYDRLHLRCTGMEFATEMIIKAAKHKARVAEVPITLHRDGREGQRSHLRTFRDGWRTLRLFLVCSPRWLFLIPGATLATAGIALGSLAFFGVQIGSAILDVHTLLVACLLFLIGVQTVSLGIFAKTFSTIEGLTPVEGVTRKFYRWFRLERALAFSAIAGLCGLGLIGTVFAEWRDNGFGTLVYPDTLRMVIPGVTLVALAVQTSFNSFMVSVLGLDRK